MYDFHPSVLDSLQCKNNAASQHVLVQRNGIGLLSQLRTECCYINGYLLAQGLNDSLLCTCGEHEDVKHYLEGCEQHEEIREKLLGPSYRSSPGE